MTEEQKRKKRERERERQNGTPVIAEGWWKKLLHKFFSWTQNRLLFLGMSYIKWMHISKKLFSRFFLCSETKEERKRTRTAKRYTSNSLKLVEEVTPQILFLDTKPFVISTDELYQVDAYF